MENQFDLKGGVYGKIEKEINYEQLNGNKAYFKGNSNATDNGSFNFSMGIYKNTEQFSYKAKYSFERKVAEIILKGCGQIEDDDEKIGGIIGLSLKFPHPQFSIYKLGVWYQEADTKMAIIHHIPQQNHIFKFSNLQYSVYKRLDKNLDLGINMAYNTDAERKYKMKVGVLSRKFDKMECSLKVDDSFKLSTSFKIDINDKAKFIISNKIDLNLREKSDSNIKNTFPFGMKLILQD